MVNLQNQNLIVTASNELNEIQNDFNRLKDTDIKVLSSTLESVTFNENLKELYLNNNREGLYQYGQPLFENLKDQYGITHFYFIKPDGHCFLRLHNKDIYDDLITRFTYWNANNTQKLSSGIELGKTAFALRVVKPYYNGSELIGYVELGEEIDHFFELLKGETNNEYSIIVEKQYLDEEKWESVKEVKGEKNNWDELTNHVILFNTIDENSEKKILSQTYFTSENANTILQEKSDSQYIQYQDQTYVFGGFPIVDAGNRQVGTVCTLIDISEHMVGYQQSILFSIILLICMVIIVIVIGLFLSQSLSNPIEKLKQASLEMQSGNLDVNIDVNSKDEIGDLAKTFNEMRMKIKENTDEINLLLKQKNSFINQLSHDLKTPLTPLNTLLPIAEKSCNNEKIKDILNICKNKVNYIMELTKNTLALAEMNSLDYNFEFKDIHVSDFIDEYVEKNIQNDEQKKITLENNISQNLIVKADPLRFEEIINNLVSNAIKYSPEGVKILFDAEKIDDHMIKISVQDNGMGLNSDQIKHVFEEFYKCDESRHDFTSTGLGLTITKRIIEKHGGKIWVESDGPGNGTTFNFTLPIKQ